MEPTGYLEQYKENIKQSYNSEDIEKEIQLILEQGEEMVIYCLLEERPDNPYKKRFKRRVGYMIAALAVMVLAGLAYMIFRNYVWLGYFSLLSMAVATVVSFFCRTVLKKYLRSFFTQETSQQQPV